MIHNIDSVVYLVLNSIDVNARYDIEQLLFIGIIMSPHKPQYGAILVPLIEKLRESFLYPMNFTTLAGDTIRLRILTILVILDMGERNQILNMIDVGGYFSCHRCTTKGIHLGKFGVRFPGW